MAPDAPLRNECRHFDSEIVKHRTVPLGIT